MCFESIFYYDGGSSCGIVVKTLDCDIIVNKFELYSYYQVCFQTNTTGESYEPPLILPSYRLNSSSTNSTSMALALNNPWKLIHHWTKETKKKSSTVIILCYLRTHYIHTGGMHNIMVFIIENGTCNPNFKPWMRLFAFHFVLMLLGKALIHLFSLSLC